MHLNKTDRYNSLLLRQSYRFGSKVKKRNLVNVTQWADTDKQLLGDLLANLRKFRKSWLAADIKASIESLLLKYPSRGFGAYAAIGSLVDSGQQRAPQLQPIKRQEPELIGIEETIRQYHPWLLANSQQQA